MTDMSATCPGVEIRYAGPLGGYDEVHISADFNDPRRDEVSVASYDLDAFIEEITRARDKLRSLGVSTAWSHDADGQGNCGPIPSGEK